MVIEGAFNRAFTFSQDSYIKPKTKIECDQTENKYKHAFISTYSHSLVQKILTKHWYILKNNPL